jgi:isopentenyl phosphate kinase
LVDLQKQFVGGGTGGAAITNKGELESIDEGSLRLACEQLWLAMSDGDDSPKKVLSMDWSRRHGDPTDPAVDAEGFARMAGLGLDTNFILVHGAGIAWNLNQLFDPV